MQRFAATIGLAAIAIVLALLLLSGCSSGPRVDAVPLGPSPAPIPVESVRFADPAPEGCASVARLTASAFAADGNAHVQRAFRERAASLGANVLVLSVSGGGSVEVMRGVTANTTQYSALALDCP